MTAYTDKIKRRREWMVRVGVYLAIGFGVLSQWAVQRFDPHELILDIRMTGWSIGRVITAAVTAALVYRLIDGKGELSGKVKNVKRVLILGYTAGFTLQGISGIGE